MAELDVQPKRRSSGWPWLLLALLLLILVLFLWRGCGNDKTVATTTDSSTVTAATMPANGQVAGWDSIDFNAPAASYEEITDSNINVRGNENYAVYSLGENILFDEGKSTIRRDAEKNLRQLAASIQKRFNGGQVRVYGHTDSIGSAGSNKQLAEQRSEAVRNWLIINAKVSSDRISTHPVGESQPVASNNTEAGRQQNRRVEVVAKK
jgi:outer membrane protein OmpA-like peptidoglycan-associated protein